MPLVLAWGSPFVETVCLLGVLQAAGGDLIWSLQLPHLQSVTVTIPERQRCLSQRDFITNGGCSAHDR